MQKKKSPVLLVTIVAAVALGMVGLNMSGVISSGGLREIKAPNQEAIEDAHKRQQASAESRIPTLKEKSMIGNISAGGPTANLVKGIPEEPSIAMPKTAKPTMKFETDRTSSHWYNEESKQSEEAEANAKKKGN